MSSSKFIREIILSLASCEAFRNVTNARSKVSLDITSKCGPCIRKFDSSVFILSALLCPNANALAKFSVNVISSSTKKKRRKTFIISTKI